MTVADGLSRLSSSKNDIAGQTVPVNRSTRWNQGVAQALAVARVGGPSCSRAQGTQKRRASTEQEPEVIPVAASGHVVEGKMLPAAKDMDEKDDPGGETIP